MLFEDTYQTIKAPSEGIFRDRGSKFIAFAYPINQEQDLKENVNILKSLHPKANHHCWAIRLGIDKSVFRLNDDGEPSGTAGRPILNTLLSKELTNLGVVVVRYFGGTLLGVPGLINAYKCATEEAINKAEIIILTVNDVYTITFDYLQMNNIMKVIKDDGLIIIKQEFDNNCTIQLSIRKSRVNQTLNKFNNMDGVNVAYDFTI
jgi:uncharacterized YigZ family protein